MQLDSVNMPVAVTGVSAECHYPRTGRDSPTLHSAVTPKPMTAASQESGFQSKRNASKGHKKCSK